jgi:glycosyltransferase involved in cell wall biosynthesis
MNIVIDTRALLGAGGVPQYTRQIIRHLNSEGKNIFLFCNSLRRLKNFESRFAKIFFRIPNKILNLSLLLCGRPYIDRMVEKRLGKKVDLFILPNINFWKSKGDKKIVIAHDLSFAIHPRFFNLRDRIWHRAIKPRELYGAADIIIAVSENTKRDLTNIFGIREEKIRVVYPGVSIDARELQNKKGNYILYLASLEPRKNVLGLIDAYERVDTDMDLVIAGAGKYKPIIQWKVAISPKRKKIKLVGHVREGEKIKFINEAQLFVYPSFYEGFGFPPLEAQVLGVPVIASLTSSMSEVLGDSALLVNPHDSNEIARAISEVIDNRELRDILIERGLENAKRFSWQKSVKEIGGIIDNIAATRSI